MSTWREQLSGETTQEVAYEWLARYYHYPVLALLVVFGLWTRIRSWERFVVGDTVLFSGNDPFYHLRSVQYVVANWPATMPFDPWTNFPQGTATSQFGTLFDQLIATAALVVGLGSPSEELVRHVVLFAPAVFGVLTFVPAYFIGRRLGGRFGGVLAVGILAFSTGALFRQGWVGVADHHIAEALFQALGVLGIMVAVSAAEAEKPVYELVAEREFETIRWTLGWSVLGGVAVGSYLWVWPPGVLLLGILGVFFVVYLSVEFVRGRSPEHVAIAGAVALATAGVLALSTTRTLDVSATQRSLLQPGLAFAVAAGCVFMAWLARVWERRDLSPRAYPAGVGVTGLALFGLLAVLAPGMADYLVQNVLRVLGLGYGTSATAQTVGEIDPMPLGQLIDFYGLAAVTAFGTAAVVLLRLVLDDEPRGQEFLLVVWIVFVLLASLTQARFAYYLTIPVAGLNALLAGWVLGYVNRTTDGRGVETHQVLTVATIILLVLAPMVAFGTTAAGAAAAKGPGGDIQGWQHSLEWLQDNTPEPGQYGNPDGDPMEYLGTYDRTDDFDYESGAYGIMSWWDYGHWITTNGERIPNANPFQQGSDHAARFLLSQDESSALSELEARDEDDAETRYVMVDWEMAETENLRPARGKFFAPPAFIDNVSRADYYSRILDPQGGNPIQATQMIRQKQPYYQSMTARLYHYHGSAKEPDPVVVNWQGGEQVAQGLGPYTFAPSGPNASGRTVRVFDTMAQAQSYVNESRQTRQIGGVGAHPAERVEALEHFRLVHTSPQVATQHLNGRGYLQGLYRTAGTTGLTQELGLTNNRTGLGRAASWMLHTDPSWTKTFERVKGATIRGTGPENTTVTARVPLQPENAGQFTYTQRARTDENGEFELTVPYATTGYGEWGVEDGHTNTSVRATGPYQFGTGLRSEGNSTYTYSGSVNVTEGQVLGEDDTAATVSLEREELNTNIGGGGSGDSTSGSDGQGGSSDGADAQTTGSDGGDGTDDSSAGSDGQGDTADGGAGTTGSDDGAGGTSGDTDESLQPPAPSADPAQPRTAEP